MQHIFRYLRWYEHKNRVLVRHRNSEGGEFKFEYEEDGKKRHFLIDGYVERPGKRPLAIEFNG